MEDWTSSSSNPKKVEILVGIFSRVVMTLGQGERESVQPYAEPSLEKGRWTDPNLEAAGRTGLPKRCSAGTPLPTSSRPAVPKKCQVFLQIIAQKRSYSTAWCWCEKSLQSLVVSGHSITIFLYKLPFSHPRSA